MAHVQLKPTILILLKEMKNNFKKNKTTLGNLIRNATKQYVISELPLASFLKVSLEAHLFR